MNGALWLLVGFVMGAGTGMVASALEWERRERRFDEKQASNLKILGEAIARHEFARQASERMRQAADESFERNKRYHARMNALAEHGEPPEG